MRIQNYFKLTLAIALLSFTFSNYSTSSAYTQQTQTQTSISIDADGTTTKTTTATTTNADGSVTKSTTTTVTNADGSSSTTSSTTTTGGSGQTTTIAPEITTDPWSTFEPGNSTATPSGSPSPSSSPEVTEQPTASANPNATIIVNSTRYVYQEDTNTYKVDRYLGSSSTISVPDHINEIPVTCIGEEAFSYSTAKKISLPDTITTIEKNSFWGSDKLQQLIVPKSVISIGTNWLKWCNKTKLTVIAPSSSFAYKRAVADGFMVSTNTKLKLKVNTKFFIPGSSAQLSLYNQDGTVRYKSSKPLIASVSSTGKITAIRSGTFQISATSGGNTCQLQLKVLPKNEKNMVKYICKNIAKKDMSDYEKIKATHAWLIKNVRYDYYGAVTGREAPDIHTAKGALVNGLAVCDGYSYAFQKIMKYYNIPCKVVKSYSMMHAWNMVKIKNKWYHIDVTYDDPIINYDNTNTRVFTNYFLITDSRMARDHTWPLGYPTANSTTIDKKYRTKK